MNTRTGEQNGAPSNAPSSHETDAAYLASDVPAQHRMVIKTDQPVKLPLDEGFITIMAQAAQAGDVESRRAEVNSYARTTMQKAHGAEISELESAATETRNRVRGITERCADLGATLKATRPYTEADRQTEPMTLLSTAELGFLGCKSLALIGVGVISTATVLRESGIASFENPIRCLFFSMMPIGLAAGVTYLSHQFESPKARRDYHTTVWAFGIILAIFWAALFASTFNGMTQNAEDLARALALNATTPAERNGNWLLPVVSILAEATLTAGCWLTMIRIVEKHQAPSRQPNPAYRQTQAEINRWRALEADEQQYLRRIEGRLRTLYAVIEQYVADADALFLRLTRGFGSSGTGNGVIVNGNPPDFGPLPPVMAAVLMLLVSFLSLNAASTTVIGISSKYQQSDRELVYQKIARFVLGDAQPGTTIAVYDALRLQPIVTLAIPDGATFRNNPRARLQRLQRPLTTLKEFFVASAHSTGITNVGTLNVPEFLELVATHVRRSDEPCVVVLVGSPFYVDPDGTCSTVDAFPSDAHLSVDQSRSPFGSAGKQGTLSDVTVHYAYLHEAFVNDFHKERLSRFMSLLLSQRSGVLSSFTANLDLVMARVRDDIRTPFMAATRDPNDIKVEMRRVTPRTVPVGFQPTNLIVSIPDSNAFAAPQPATNSVPRQVTSEPLVTLATQQATNTKFGIGFTLTMNVDVDLYILPYAGAQELYFGDRTSLVNLPFKNYQGQSSQFVDMDFGSSVDVAQIRAWINLFAGQAPKVHGEIIIGYEGKDYRAPFTFRATTGNGGKDSHQRATSPHWVEIDIPRILGLSTAHAAK